MLFLIMSLVAAVILFPVLYFLPLSLTWKGKAFLTVTAFIIAAASFAAMDYVPLWQLFGLMAILILVISYIGATRLEGILVLSKSDDHMASATDGAVILFGDRERVMPPAEDYKEIESFNDKKENDPVFLQENKYADEGYLEILDVPQEDLKQGTSLEKEQSITESEEYLEQLENEDVFLGSEDNAFSSDDGQDVVYISPLEDLLNEETAETIVKEENEDVPSMIDGQAESVVENLEESTVNFDDKDFQVVIDEENSPPSMEQDEILEVLKEEELEPLLNVEQVYEIPILEEPVLENLPSDLEDEKEEILADEIEEYTDEIRQISEWNVLEPQSDEDLSTDVEDIRLSEELLRGEREDSNHPAAEKRFVDWFLDQVKHYETVMDPEEREVFIKTHLSEDLSEHAYFLAATELLKLYQDTMQLEKFHKIAVALNAKYEHYPLVQEQIRFLYEQFLITNQRW